MPSVWLMMDTFWIPGGEGAYPVSDVDLALGVVLKNNILVLHEA